MKPCFLTKSTLQDDPMWHSNYRTSVMYNQLPKHAGVFFFKTFLEREMILAKSIFSISHILSFSSIHIPCNKGYISILSSASAFCLGLSIVCSPLKNCREKICQTVHPMTLSMNFFLYNINNGFL